MHEELILALCKQHTLTVPGARRFRRAGRNSYWIPFGVNPEKSRRGYESQRVFQRRDSVAVCAMNWMGRYERMAWRISSGRSDNRSRHRRSASSSSSRFLFLDRVSTIDGFYLIFIYFYFFGLGFQGGSESL